MKKINVYDIDDFLKNDVNMAAFHYKNAAIIEGPNGVILAEHEAVHQMENLITDSVVLDLTPIPSPGKHYIVPTHTVAIQLSEIKEKAKCVEMTMDEFFDRKDYNWRCKDNFNILLSSMREIGLNPDEFLKEQSMSLDEQIKAAEDKKPVVNNKEPKEKSFEMEH